MKKDKLYDKYFVKLYNAVEYMMQAYARKDLLRNHTNYGSATAYASMLIDMGHDVELCVYGEGDYLITDHIKVNGKDYDFFH